MKRQLTAIIAGTMLTIIGTTLPASATVTSTNSQYLADDLPDYLKDAKKHGQSVVKQQSISLAEDFFKYGITPKIADEFKYEFNRSSQNIFRFTPFSSLVIVILIDIFAQKTL